MENNEKYTGNKALTAINGQLLGVQKKVSDWANDKCRNASAKVLMAILIIFCSVFSILLVMLIMGRF